jgi:hypothetical protein
MQLSQYVSNLLYRYECVVVPDFGAFLAHKIPAEIQENTNSFYPPKKQLSFNVQLQSNDGVLANHISEIEQISYENALAKIAKQVAALKLRLEKNETLEFQNIGALQNTKDGQLVFEPSYNLNYLTEAFGLTQFVSPTISRATHLKIVEEIENKTPITLSSEKRKTRSVFKYAAVAVVMLGLGGVFGSNVYMQHIEQENILAQEKANIALDNKIQEATFVVSSPLPAITLDINKSVGNYHIVAGAFRIEANCNRKLRQLKRLGYSARKIGQNSYGLHQVVYDSYQTRQEAQRALYNIKRTQDSSAWLLIKLLP